jgi:hypothetical protein
LGLDFIALSTFEITAKEDSSDTAYIAAISFNQNLVWEGFAGAGGI